MEILGFTLRAYKGGYGILLSCAVIINESYFARCKNYKNRIRFVFAIPNAIKSYSCCVYFLLVCCTVIQLFVGSVFEVTHEFSLM